MIRAVFPGSFDPFTNGHLDIVKRCVKLFDEVIVGVGDNLSKKYWFSIEERVELAKQSTAGMPGVQVKALDGLLAKWCVENDANVIVKGLRSAVDAGFELPQATINRELGDIETILLATNPALAHISSTIVKEVAANGGDVSSMVSAGVKDTLDIKIRG